MRCVPRASRFSGVALALVLGWVAGAMPGLGDNLPQKRVALVIGNSHYHDGTDISGIEDALAMEEALRELDFTVLEPVRDADQDAIRTNLKKLSEQIRDATLVVFFYSGHGFQLQGNNFLFPVGGDTTAEAAVSLTEVIAAVEAAPAAVKIVILDACRTKASIPPQQRGPVEPPNTTAKDKILFAFATSPGQVSVSLGPQDRSPYTTALLRHLREPGLEIKELLTRTKADAILASGQVPQSFGLDGLGTFYLRPPVSVQAVVDRAENDLILLLNGEIRFDREAHSRNPAELRLHAGDNPLVALVASQRTFHNTHSWDKTEGWGYCLRLIGPGGTELKLPHCSRNPCFSASEDVPFKDGIHHGKVFTVARAVLHVDPVTAALTVADADTEAWNRDVPLAEQDQDVLFQVGAAEVLAKALNVAPDALTRTLAQLPGILTVFFPSLPPFQVPDLAPWVARVRGNRAFTASAAICMKDHENDRVRDLREGINAVLVGNPLPLKIFDDGLSACVQSEEEHRTRKSFRVGEIRIWTAFEDSTEPSQLFACPRLSGGAP